MHTGHIFVQESFSFHAYYERRVTLPREEGCYEYNIFILCVFVPTSQLLGRSIDLNRLLAQRLKSNLLRAIDLSISKFESCDICGIMVSEVVIGRE